MDLNYQLVYVETFYVGFAGFLGSVFLYAIDKISTQKGKKD